MSVDFPKRLFIGTAIVGAFAAGFWLLYSALAKPSMPDHSRSTLAALKMLGVASTIYAIDYDDKLFPAPEWSECLQPYVKDKSLFNDPVRSSMTKRAPIPYGFALYQPAAAKNFPHLPSEMPLFFPSELRVPNAAGNLDTLPPIPRLEEGHAIAFADTTVRYVRPDEMRETLGKFLPTSPTS